MFVVGDKVEKRRLPGGTSLSLNMIALIDPRSEMPPPTELLSVEDLFILDELEQLNLRHMESKIDLMKAATLKLCGLSARPSDEQHILDREHALLDTIGEAVAQTQELKSFMDLRPTVGPGVGIFTDARQSIDDIDLRKDPRRDHQDPVLDEILKAVRSIPVPLRARTWAIFAGRNGIKLDGIDRDTNGIFKHRPTAWESDGDKAVNIYDEATVGAANPSERLEAVAAAMKWSHISRYTGEDGLTHNARVEYMRRHTAGASGGGSSSSSGGAAGDGFGDDDDDDGVVHVDAPEVVEAAGEPLPQPQEAHNDSPEIKAMRVSYEAEHFAVALVANGYKAQLESIGALQNSKVASAVAVFEGHRRDREEQHEKYGLTEEQKAAAAEKSQNRSQTQSLEKLAEHGTVQCEHCTLMRLKFLHHRDDACNCWEPFEAELLETCPDFVELERRVVRFVQTESKALQKNYHDNGYKRLVLKYGKHGKCCGMTEQELRAVVDHSILDATCEMADL